MCNSCASLAGLVLSFIARFIKITCDRSFRQFVSLKLLCSGVLWCSRCRVDRREFAAGVSSARHRVNDPLTGRHRRHSTYCSLDRLQPRLPRPSIQPHIRWQRNLRRRTFFTPFPPHLSHISSLMLACCKEGTVSQVLFY